MRIRIVESIAQYEKELDYQIEKEIPVERGLVMTAEIFSQVFSPERIKLLQRIYRNNVKNIYQLAKELGKPYEVVFRNIKYLEGIGLVKIKEKGRSRIPRLAGELKIEMFA
jgi:predicted transcriptional regulator